MHDPVWIAPPPLPAPQPRAKKKNIIICCDGTGNQFGNSNSNVVKLYTALTIDNDQVGYYHPGVGTMGNPAARNRFSSFWSKVAGLAFGAGFKANVLDAYRYLMNTYDDGDRVYLFGFSRGAYTARALAGLLDGYGLLCKGNEEHMAYAWRMYLNRLKDRTLKTVNDGNLYAEAFKETYSHYEGAKVTRDNFRLHFVGLWDTVSSVGWVSTPLRLLNVAQNKSINHIRHAVSIDERRCFYQDNLYGQKAFPKQDIKQVWFAGVHSDVGGSYSQDTSGLANITLEWMMNEAKAAGALFKPERVDLVLGRNTTGAPIDVYPACQKLYNVPASFQKHVSLHGPWWLLEVLPHRYYNKDDEQEQFRIPFGSRRELPCESLVHHTVYERLVSDSKYRPGNVSQDTLTAVKGSTPLLYEYKPRHDLHENGLVRRATIMAVVGVELFLVLWLVPNLLHWAWSLARIHAYQVGHVLWQVLRHASHILVWLWTRLPRHAAR